MRTLMLLFVGSILMISCSSKKELPDVSNIKVDLTTYRFEKDFFALDSASVYSGLEQLQAKYPGFGENFLVKILNANPRWSADTMTPYVGGFLNAYRQLYTDAEKKMSDFKPYEEEIRKGLQYVKYYFPKYKTPSKIITYIGPVDGYGDALSDDAFLIGLHHHLGKDYPIYKTDMVSQFYPEYITKKFEPEYIAINCMKNIVGDLYPENEDDRVLIYQMIEKGKRLYLLSQFLPETEDYKLIGYTKEQMKSCYKNEAWIWNLFTKNGYLQSADKDIIKNYVDEGPKTPELGEDAPGNIGSFAGWQIVKKYMKKHEGTTLEQLMNTDEEKIMKEAKYKP